MSSTIYLDHNATTLLDPEVALAMQPCLIDNCCFGNPTHAHWAGIPAKNTIQQAKLQISRLINASTSEIVFTSGASESVNRAHKFYGPKGIGILFIRESLHHGLPEVPPLPELIPLIHGSAPSSVFSSGTPNLSFIIGMGKACKIAHEWNSEIYRNLLAEKTRLFWNLLTETFGDNVFLNGPPDPTRRVCNTLNVSFAGTEGEELLAKLDQVAASSGAKTEYILNQLGKPADIARGGIRFGLGKSTTTDQITETVELIEQALAKPNRQKNQ